MGRGERGRACVRVPASACVCVCVLSCQMNPKGRASTHVFNDIVCMCVYYITMQSFFRGVPALHVVHLIVLSGRHISQ